MGRLHRRHMEGRPRTSRITAGLRWEVAQPMLDVSGHEVNVQLNDALATTANVADMTQASRLRARRDSGEFLRRPRFQVSILLVGAGRRDGSGLAASADRAAMDEWATRMVNTDYNNFAPRLGIAWSPSEQMVGANRLRRLLFAGKQELHLRSQSRTGWPHRTDHPDHLWQTNVRIHKLS